jgi:hypothetical protein
MYVPIGIYFDNLFNHHRTTSNTFRATVRGRNCGASFGYESFGWGMREILQESPLIIYVISW